MCRHQTLISLPEFRLRADAGNQRSNIGRCDVGAEVRFGRRVVEVASAGDCIRSSYGPDQRHCVEVALRVVPGPEEPRPGVAYGAIGIIGDRAGLPIHVQETATGLNFPEVSPRDQAIKAMPDDETVLKSRLSKHIEHEIHELSRLASAVARSKKKGDAYRANEFYARIRRLNALLSEVLHASKEFLKKLFIRVFIDEQAVL
jgi:hypothetical protein